VCFNFDFSTDAQFHFSNPLLCAGIASVEAYHAGAVRTLLLDSADVETPYGIKVKDFITAISNLRDALDQAGTNKDEGIIAADGATILAPVDKNSVVFSRSPTQVLRIVYGNAKAKPGLFFPKGLNGAIH